MKKRLQRLYDSIAEGKTVVGVGPMSRHCIDSVVELANESEIPVILIASRRQIECSKLGGGYVWDTKSFSEYVRKKDTGDYVVLARDHGGPWQGTDESKLDHKEALSIALRSYYSDIEAGFDILHLDPSLKSRPLPDIMNDVVDLYNTCESYAEIFGNEVIYEVGTEEHGGHITELANFESFATKMKNFPKVKFIVGNIGLHVQERRNTGNMKNYEALVQICNRNNLYLKCHNVDYVDYCENNGRVNELNRRGVHSINVAPEFGVQETESLLYAWRSRGFFVDTDNFIELAYKSGKWFKWMTNLGPVPSKEEKAIICGHYIFNHTSVLEMRKRLDIDGVEEHVKSMVKWNILQYLQKTGWIAG